MRMTRIGYVNITDGAQVYLDDSTANDSDLAAGMSPDDVVSGREGGIETSKYHPPIEPAFPDSGMNQPG
jgi:hypothetical protein